MHREFRVVLLFAVISSFSALSQTRFAENPQVTVSVYNDAGVPNDTLIRAEQQAANTFSRAGLNITWLNCTHISDNDEIAVCNEIKGPIHLAMRITANVTSSIRDTAFGAAYLSSDGTGQYGDVFWKRVQELHVNLKSEVAIILGSVMAHEMGHLLLGSNAHAISGIMQAHWEGNELHRINMDTLQFLPEQGKRMRARIVRWIADLG